MQLQKLSEQPEFNFFVFGVLLNFPWEFLQVPFFQGLAEAPHWNATITCAVASLADGLIVLIAFGTTSSIWRDRFWFMRPHVWQITSYVLVGLAITLVLEHLATKSAHPVWSWRYSELMPVVPGLQIGLAPLLQWVLIPPLVIWFSRRQLR